MEGPAPLEAIAKGAVFLNVKVRAYVKHNFTWVRNTSFYKKNCRKNCFQPFEYDQYICIFIKICNNLYLLKIPGRQNSTCELSYPPDIRMQILSY